MFDALRRNLAYLKSLVPKPKPEPCDPRIAQVALRAAAALDCGCAYGRPHGCDWYDDREPTDDEPDPDAEWLRPVWEAVEEAEDAIAADPTWEPETTPFDEDEDADDDEGPLQR